MTIGIYSLYWEEQNLIYIGLSSNIEGRFKAHALTLINNVHDNYKVQQAYNLYGTPSYYILEVCSANKLNEKEISRIKEFDSINTGLNIIEGGGSSYGVNHPTSKYSKYQILKVLILLAKTNHSYIQIANRTRVNKTTVASIANSRSHTWLEYYHEYYKLATRDRNFISNKNRAVSRTGVGDKRYTYIFTSPTGDIITDTCVASLCSTHFSNAKAAQQGFSKIIHGKSSSYKGWHVIREEK